MAISISQKYSDQDFGGSPNLDQKILIFEDRVLGWQLDIAEELRTQIEDEANEGRTIQHAGFALISILFSYFEMIAQFMEGDESHGKSEKFFGIGLESVFPGDFSPQEKKTIYQRIRCGMYHSGLTKKGALIDGGYAKAIQIDGGLVKVNPHKLSPCVKAHFKGFITKLQNPSSRQERAKFEQMYNKSTKV